MLLEPLYTIDTISTIMQTLTSDPTRTPLNTITAMQLRRGSGSLLDRVFFKKESFVVKKAGQARAALVPLDDYQRFERRRQQAKNKFMAMTEQLRPAFADLSPSEIEELVSDAVQEASKISSPQT